jgi:hypothetical protein
MVHKNAVTARQLAAADKVLRGGKMSPRILTRCAISTSTERLQGEIVSDQVGRV